MVARDTPEPSPLAHEALNAKPYAFLDDAPLEERRTQAVLARRWAGPQKEATTSGRLDRAAIARVRDEAWPDSVNADELHDALVWLGFVTEAEAALDPTWAKWLEALAADRRATRVAAPHATGSGVRRAGERGPGALASRSASAPSCPSARVTSERAGRAKRRWFSSCAADWKVAVMTATALAASLDLSSALAIASAALERKARSCAAASIRA